jgi:hypothetical protein
MASASCAEIAAPGRARGSVRAVYRSQASPMACGDTCGTVCAKASAGTCAGGVYVPLPGDKDKNHPASVPGELGLLTYRFPKKACTSAGCEQSNFCCCMDTAADESPNSPLKVDGAVLLVSGDSVDRADANEVGRGDRVMGWADQSGHRNTAFAEAQADAPVLKMGMLNALPIVAFTSQTTLRAPASVLADASAAGGITIIAVARPNRGGPILQDPKGAVSFGLTRDSGGNTYSATVAQRGADKIATGRCFFFCFFLKNSFTYFFD